MQTKIDKSRPKLAKVLNIINMFVNKKEVGVLILIDFVFDSVDPLICGPSIEFVGIIAWSINQVSQLSFLAMKRNLLEKMS